MPGRDPLGKLGGKRNKRPLAVLSRSTEHRFTCRSCSQRARVLGLVCMCVCWAPATVSRQAWARPWQKSEGQGFFPRGEL